MHKRKNKRMTTLMNNYHGKDDTRLIIRQKKCAGLLRAQRGCEIVDYICIWSSVFHIRPCEEPFGDKYTD